MGRVVGAVGEGWPDGDRLPESFGGNVRRGDQEGKVARTGKGRPLWSRPELQRDLHGVTAVSSDCAGPDIHALSIAWFDRRILPAIGLERGLHRAPRRVLRGNQAIPLLWRAMMPSVTHVVHSDPEILGGTPVFVGTRVPAQTLFDYLEGGETLDEFLRQFPSVSRDQALVAIEMAPESVLDRARSP